MSHRFNILLLAGYDIKKDNPEQKVSEQQVPESEVSHQVQAQDI